MSPRDPGSRWLLTLVSVLVLASCGKTVPDRPEWVIRSQLVFLTADFSGQRAPLPVGQFRLLFPYIAGDIYGSPTTGDFFDARVGADYRFEINLNRTHGSLLASLEPTQLSQSYLHIEPAAARVARLAPMIMESDGIEQLGRTDWFDPDSGRPLLLLYLDRPATISGHTIIRGRPLRYAIHVAAPGYVWVGQQALADEDVFSVTPRPARLLLAVTPLD
ncbi:MAG: hypothetical protein ACJ8R9_32825 [Steroidobacteraceae bacterium]